MSFLDLFGVLATLTLCGCYIPQVYESIKTGRTGMNGWMSFLCLVGLIEMLIFTYLKTGDAILCINLCVSIVFSCVIFYYKIFPRKT